MPMTVRPISARDHLDLIAERGSASFLQCPSWGAVKSQWRSESLGWFDATATRPHAAGLVLYRRLPLLPRWLAYLPEGPLLDWEGLDEAGLVEALRALVAHLREQGAFAVRLGPPVPVRAWDAETVKAGLADPDAHRLTDLPPTRTFPAGARVAAALREVGFRPPPPGAGFSAGQPRFVFQLPLAGRSDADLLAGFNQLWRRNVRRAERAGVSVRLGEEADLVAFHALYAETAARDGFTGRPLSYFQRMWRAMVAEDPDRLRLYLAEHEGELVAATTLVQVGTHAWYSYGASSTARREVRGSNAVQWRMMRDARERGASVYDLRGISEVLDPEDHLVGLVQFKVGTGGEAVELLGEWELPLDRLLAAAVGGYLRRRGG